MKTNKKASAEKAQIARQSTGLPPEEASDQWAMVSMECLSCGHVYEGSELNSLVEDHTNLKPDLNGSERAYRTCVHCGSQKGFKHHNENGEYAVSCSNEGFVREAEEIRRKADEYFDRVWYVRHLTIGEPEAGAKAASEYRAKFGDLPEDFGDWDYGYWSGHLAALRWALGEEEHVLDT